jgi:hemerythrin
MKNSSARNEAENIIDQLAEYAVVHFRDEEILMEKAGFPMLLGHKMEHSAFVKKVSEFRDGLKVQKILLTFEMLNFMKGWLINHIMDSDQKYSAYLKKAGLSD